MTNDDLPHATVIHAGDGRSRLRIASRRDDVLFFASVAAGLSSIRGVRDVKTTPLTGSILIFHDASLSSIGEEAERRRLLSLVVEESAASGETYPAPPLPIGPRTAAAAVLGLIALWQIYREKYFPSALSVIMHAIVVAGLLPPDDASPAND